MLRPVKGRRIAGVCAGLAAQFGISVSVVRLLFVLLSLAGGAGMAVYLFWWLTVPSGEPGTAAPDAIPPQLARLAKRLSAPKVSTTMRRPDVLAGALLLGVAAFLVATRVGWQWNQSWILPSIIAVAGLALAWSQLDSVAKEDSSWRGSGVLRVVGGVGLVLAGVLVFIGRDTPGWALFQAAMAMLAFLVGMGLALAPWWLRLLRTLGDERAARARESERADIAAHLHDSVLQTLALIRANADDSAAVARMARSQERELREWLYADRPEAGTSLVAELKAIVAEVEDGQGVRGSAGVAGMSAAVPIDLVTVGDCAPTDALMPLLQAGREALHNAAAHGKPPISVYFEVRDAAVELFVRDRGDGFDMDAIADDRYGVRESIIGRVHRHGGTAEIVSRPAWGTEVRLTMPRA
jgi:signal transduction histidine kinase/phage shock protein PspC (stress-responsive transcriptional regulator)